MEIPAEHSEPVKMTMERVVTGEDEEWPSKPEPNQKNINESVEMVEEGKESAARADSLKMNAGLLQFPENLMSLLDSGKVAEIVRWLPDGDAFCLMPALFAERVLDKYFQGTKFESFTRKLNRWGFKRVAGQKVPPNTIAYYHKDFIRGSPKLLKNMHGGKAKNASAREKQLRAQQKRAEDSDALLLATSQLQQTAKNEDAAQQPAANIVGSLDQNHQLQLLASNSIAMEQELRNRKLQQQLLLYNTALQSPYFDPNRSFALQQQRDEIQMALLLQQKSVHAMRDPINSVAMARNPWMNTPANLPIDSSAFSALQYSRLQNHPSFASGINLSAAGRLLLSQQFSSPTGSTSSTISNGMSDNSTNVMLQRLMEARVAGNNNHVVTGNNSFNASDSAATRIMQQQLLDEQRQLASTVSNSETRSAVADQQLLELYLLQQQRNSGSNSGSTS